MNVRTGSNDAVAYEDRALEGRSYEGGSNEIATNKVAANKVAPIEVGANEREAIEVSSDNSASNVASTLTVVLGGRSNGGSSKEKVIKLII